MNNSATRIIILATLTFSLTGCFDIPDNAELNSSWPTLTAQHAGDSDSDSFVTLDAPSCPQLLTNTQRVDKPLSETASQTISQLPAEFNVASWNIYKQGGDDWLPQLEKLTSSHDLVMLQEAKLSFLLQQLFQRQQLSWTQVEAFSIYDQPMGVLTAGKVAPQAVCKQTVTEPWIRFPKSSLISYFDWAGSDQPLLVANTHMINFTLGVDEFNQQLAGMLAVINQHPGPVILTGDFNTWTNKRINELLALTDAAGLKQVSYRQDVRVTAFGHALDAMFFRGMHLINASSYTADASDHNPIVASFGPL